MTTKTTTAKPASATKMPLHAPSAATAMARAAPSPTHTQHVAIIPIRMEPVTRQNVTPSQGKARAGSLIPCAPRRDILVRIACNVSALHHLAGVAVEVLVVVAAEADQAADNLR